MWISQAQAARMIGKTPQWIYYHVKQGNLKSMKSGLKKFLDKEEVKAYQPIDKKLKHGKRKKNP